MRNLSEFRRLVHGTSNRRLGWPALAKIPTDARGRILRGVTVAKEIELKDRFEIMGAQTRRDSS